MKQPDRIEYSPRRKRLAIVISGAGELIVKAPRFTGRRQIDNFLSEKSHWIENKLKLTANQPKPQKHDFKEGEAFYYLGKKYPLVFAGSNSTGKAASPLRLAGGQFVLRANDQKRAGSLFIAWYKERAFSFVCGLIKKIAPIMKVKYTRVNITSARKRWGSCSGKGSLNFTWRLIQAEPLLIEYVVVHELAHLRQRNHSKFFWAFVGRFFADYKAIHNRLREKSAFLQTEF